MKVHREGRMPARPQPEDWLGLRWSCRCGAQLELNQTDDFQEVGETGQLILTECPYCRRPKTFSADQELSTKFRSRGLVVDSR